MKSRICFLVAVCACIFAGCGGNPDSTDNLFTRDVVEFDSISDSGLLADGFIDTATGHDSGDSVDEADNGGDNPDSAISTDEGGPDVAETVAPTETNYLVIASDSLLASATELAEYRQSRGYRTEVMTRSDVLGSEFASTANWENMARGHIARLAGKLPSGEILFVVLVGDAEAVSDEGFMKPIPTVDCENVLTDICYTDNTIADLDNDYVPDVAIGRITASSDQEVRDYLDKIRAHESGYDPGLFNRRISLYVGEAGFGEAIDTTLETFTFMGLDRISHAFDIVGAYASENSSYYYSPFNEKVLELINAGSLMTLYIGHGNPGWTQGLTVEQIEDGLISCSGRLPVMVFLACLNGDFDDGDDSISEAMLHLQNGPVAVFASSDESHPVGNAVLAYEISRVGLGERPDTVGELFMRVKDEMINNNDEFRSMINDASTAFGEQGADDPHRIYREHADLYNLLGDPAVEMKFPPASIDSVEISGSLSQKSVTVSGTVSGFSQGSAYVTFEVSRGEILGNLISNPETDAEIQANWEIANNKVFAADTVDVLDGEFTALLEWETTVGAGDRYVKVYAWDGTELGEGTVDAVAEKWTNK